MDERIVAPSQVSPEVFWPGDLLPKDCPTARILTFGYESQVASFFGGAVSQNSVSASARNLLFALTRYRRNCVSVIVYSILLYVSLANSRPP